MNQIDEVVETLKLSLKSKQMTYRMLARELAMSEANVKRMFSQKQFTLNRIEQICDLLEMALSDLFMLVENNKTKLTSLKSEQEQELVDNPKLFLVAACVRDGWKFGEIISHYQIEELECVQLLAKLDRLKMIQLLPGNRYKVLIAQDFKWITNGPLERFMRTQGIGTFMDSDFTEPNNFKFYMRGTYSQASIDLIKGRLEQLKKEVAARNLQDAALPLKHRQHIGLLFAMRPWELPLFSALKRK